jgi:hypothetical protein
VTILENMMDGLRLREEDMPVPRAPDELVDKHGQQLAIFHSPAYGFDNSFPSRFTILSRQFYTLEQYMVWQKARYFGDEEMAAQVLLITNAVRIRRLSQRIRGFQLEEWNNVREKVSSHAQKVRNCVFFHRSCMSACGQNSAKMAISTNNCWPPGMPKSHWPVWAAPIGAMGSAHPT